jgi:hypothetical protein
MMTENDLKEQFIKFGGIVLAQAIKQVSELKKIPSNEIDLHYNMGILDAVSLLNELNMRLNK